MGKYRTRELTQRVRYALLAGVAGAFLIPQVAAAAPTGGEVVFGGATIPPTSSDMNITSSNPNNVITWRDYSIAQGERVRYDNGAKTNNYLNIVTGANTSNINGTIEGGKDVYIVNPNGVIFGKTASVNVGNLYVSTQETSTVGAEAFETSGTAPLSTTAVGKADVVNMGSITANKVEVYGRSIRILDAANVHATTSPVILHTDTAANDGYAHIGYKSGAGPAATAYKINGANAVAADNYYQLVSTPTDFQNINSDLTQNYMLANDIDFTDPATHAAGEITPIGGNTISTASGTTARPAYSGKFDGNFFRVQNFKVTDANLQRSGLFGALDHAEIYNLGVTGATVQGSVANGSEYAGGLAAVANNGTKLTNVYVRDTTVSGNDDRHGGLVGYTADTTIDSAYTKVAVATGGGFVGETAGGTVITNTYSEFTNSPGTSGAHFINRIMPASGTTVKNSYTKGEFSNYSSIPNVTGTYIIDDATKTARLRGNSPGPNNPPAYITATYTGWSINNTGAPGAKWRIYEGRTLPLLTAFMNGRVDSVGSVGANYSYRKFNQADGTAVNDVANKATSNDHKDVTALTYDSKIVKIVDGNGNVGNTSNVTYDKTLDTTTNKIYTYEDTGSPQNTTDNIRNAGTKAILWSDQDGPNLRNVNITIAKRKVSVQGSNIVAMRRYDGTRDVTEAFKTALQNGGITAGGFTPEDLNDPDPSRRIKITPSTDFKAMMANKDAEDDKEVTFSGKLTFAGDNKDNYDIGDFDFTTSTNTAKGKANITKAPLILKVVKDSTTKIYDGTDAVTDATMNADPNIKLDETLHYNNETVAADIKSDETHKKDDVSINYANIGRPTYIKSDGSAEVHAGTHKIRYKNVELQGNDAKNYELYYQMPDDTTQTKVTSNQIDLKGTITPRGISTKDFKVYKKADDSAASAERVYDGTVSYTPGSDVYLSSNVGASTAPDTGIVDRDRNKITFGLVGDKAYFTKDDNATKTSHVSEAKRITYNIKAEGDSSDHRFSDYYYTDGTTKVGELTDAVVASGEGRITPKALTAAAVRGLNKTYDGMAEYTDGSQNVKRGDEVVTFTGWTSDSDKRTNESTATYVNASNADDANVAYAGTAVTTKNIKYTAKLTGQYADDYAIQKIANTVISTATNSGTPNVAVTADLGVEANAGTISPRDVQVTFKNVTKVYDGTANNNKIEVDSLDDKLSGRVFAKDGTNTGSFSTAGITSRYGTKGTPFEANVNASDNPYDVEYANISNPLGGNYHIDSTLYGKGTITRRRINPDGFQVLRKQSDGTYQAERITKTYDGTSTYTLPDEAYLRTPTVTPTPSDKTGIIKADKDKIRFRLATNTHGTFQKTDGTETTHVSEAKKVAYQVVAYGVEGATETDEPLKNYTFGTATEETAHTLKNLENLKEGKTPAAVLADGSITPAKIVAETVKNLNKTYDGVTGYTKGDRNTTAASVTGENVIKFKHLNQNGSLTDGLINDASGMPPVNSSTAAYVDKNVLYNTQKEPVAKAMNYTAKLTGKYADDYEIVDANHPNTKLSTMTESGGTKNVLTVFNNVADAGTISPRKLTIEMDKDTAEKTYDGTAENKKAKVNAITSEDIASNVLRQILDDDGISENALTNRYVAKLTATPPTATSTYGRFSGTTFNEDANASNGNLHDVRYQNMKDTFDEAFASGAGKEKIAGNYTFDNTVYGKGTITRKAITPDTFKVSGGKATKAYDGTSAYTVPAGSTLTANTGELVGTDASKIQFAISGNSAKFMKTDGVTETANVADARKVAYNITVSGDRDTIRNYTLNGQNLESGNLTASGDGEITRRALSLGLVQDEEIDKFYDGSYRLVDKGKNWNKLKDEDEKGNVVYTGTNKLVNDGTSLTITSEYRNDANTDHDKNVRGTSASPQVKDILYNISITGGDPNNYSFDGGTSSAAGGLKLSAKGTIKPKDISNAFQPMTKVYDGGTTVDRSKVNLESGTFIGSDSAWVKNTYQAEFESPNVNGNSEGKNWVNYTHLELDGTNANNYTIASATTGKGNITPYILNSDSVKFTTREASKVYDGTTDVKWTNGSSEPNDVKNYITGATVELTPAGGGATTTKSVLEALNLTEKPQYDKKDVDGGSATDRVTYKLSYTGTNGNFSLGTGVTSFTTKGDGIITPKDVNVTVKSLLTKTYDATENVTAGTVKNAAGETVSDLNKNITLDGIVAGDGTTYTTTAAYDNKNAGTNKTVTYDVKLDAASAGNYTLKFNNTKVSTLNPVQNGKNEITKRRVNVTFGDVSKLYDTTTKNNKPIVGTVSAEDAAVLNSDHAGLVADDTPNNIKNKLQNLAGLDSDYGTVKTDGSFDADPNVGTKSVQYAGLRNRMNTTLGGDAGNYEFDVNGYGKGSIARRTIDASKFKFKTNAFAEKEYDGGFDVKWQGDKDKIKNYFASSKVEIDGVERDINLKDIDVSTEYSKYRTKDVGAYQTTADGKKYNAKVDYRISFSSQNFDITGLTTGGYIPYEDNGIITPKDVNVTVKSLLRKNYDATENVTAGMVKNAAGETVSDLNKNITLDGIVAGDGTTYTTTAAYDNKNAGTNKTVTYDVKLDAASAGNYTLKFNNTKVSTLNPVQNGKNEITKRRVNVTFGDVSKLYDTTTKNNKPIVGTVSAEDAAVLNSDHAGLVADDTPNNIKNKLQNLAGLDSDYGTVKTDGSFDADPNVGTKSVQYAGLRNRMNTTLGGDAGNYEFDVNGYGKGSIARRTIDASKFKFKTNAFAEKEYDGGFDVKWQGDKDKIKNYFASSKVEIDGVERDINLKDIDVSTEYSKYRTKDVGAYQTTADGKKYNAKVDYRISFSSDNFDITGLTAGGYIPYEDKGLITPKDITPYFTKDHIIKEYDGSSRLSDPNKEAIEKTKRLSILVQGDDVTLDVVGRYMDSTRTQEEKNASADTKEDAQARTNTTAGLSVAYDLKLGGAQKNNYTIGAQGDTGTVYGTGDIYKKTLTVDVGRKVKEYDGTAAVNNLTKNDVTFQGMVNNESLKLDDDSIKKVKGQYLDSAGKPDANVSRDADRKVLYKAVEYTGLNDALNDLAARDSHSTAKNYRVEGGSRRYTADDGKGRIDPLKFHDPSNDVKMTFAATGPSKTYDRETTVKYKGLGTGKALKNYLTDATVMVGGKARSIKDELEIDPTRTHYDNKNAGTGKTVTYGFAYKGNNFEIADFTKESDVKGEIKRKDVKVLPVDQLWKTYDSERDVYVEGDDSISTRRGGEQRERVTTGNSVLEVEPDGIISGDVVQNDSWAEFEDENAGTGKKVKYHTSFSGTDAANYRFVDVSGGEITKPLETDNNTIAKRKLNIGFDGLPYVTKPYDTDAKNDKITARITNDPNGSARKVLARDKVHVFGDRLTQLNNTNIQSDYGEGKTDQTFRSDPNAGHKDVQYRGVGKAIRNILGGSADNYETVPDNAYSDGAITKAEVSRSEFDPNFTHAHKEYDGTSDVQNLDERYDKEHSFWNSHKLDPSNIESLTGSYRGTPAKRGKDVGTNKIVDYTLKLSNRNFNFVGWDGVIQKEGTGDITPREIFEDSRSPLTKVYDGTRNIANVGDDLLTFRHKSGERPFIKNDDVRNSSTATYDNANVAWKNNVWKQGEGTVGDVNVTYRLKLMGRDAENYKIVSAPGRTVKDSVDQDGTRTQTTDGTGKITPRDIHLKADPQTRWINEGLPDSYSGTPMGSNLGRKDVPELVPGEVLPGQIEYSSPNARLLWDNYAINGTYRAPKAGTRYQLPDGTWTTQSFVGGDGDAVSRNYRFVQDTANKSAFHMGPYVPDYEYYKAMTQVSKMTPDEYAYENASLDRRRSFGRDPEAEIAYTPPSINTIKDGVDITQTGIHVTDETVFSLVNEVFGGK